MSTASPVLVLTISLTGKAHTVYPDPAGDCGHIAPFIPLIHIFKLLYFILVYNFCWIFLNHCNCLGISYKVTESSTDYQI